MSHASHASHVEMPKGDLGYVLVCLSEPKWVKVNLSGPK